VKHLRLAHSAEPLKGTVRARWGKPISHVTIRPNHPSLSVFDYDAERVTDEEFLAAASLLANYGRDSGKPDLHMAAQALAAWVNDHYTPGNAS
jgi:hypothetical protein